MSAAATFLSPNEAGRLLARSPLGASNKNFTRDESSDLLLLASRLDSLAEAVRVSWADLPEDLRSGLTNMVYMSPRHLTVARRIRGVVSATFAYARDPDGIRAFVAARNRLVDAVLTAIEEEDESYQSQLQDLLDDLQLEEMVGEALEPGREREYLRSL